MLGKAGYKTGFTSTAMFSDGNKEWLNDKKMTMVGRFFTQKILRTMVRNGCRFAIIETTSEGIRQYRHRFINYDIVIFTGLYPEHIESHGSFENYKKAKGELFRHLSSCRIKYTDNKKIIIKTISSLRRTEFDRVKKTIIVNGDDEHADYFLNFWSENKISYTQGDKNFGNNVEIVKYGNIKTDKKGTSFKINDFLINLQILGDFNVVNTMNAICVGMVFNVKKKKMKESLEKINGIAGRFEKIDEGQDFLVVVDYAYEPKAISKLYEVVNILNHKKIIHVLGSCGGGRDVARRPQLGKLAIEKAIKLAQKGDIVLITGKGNEQYICIEYGKKIPWDDRMVVRELLKNEFN